MFEGDEVIVKHDNNYDEENEDRLGASAECGGARACSQKGVNGLLGHSALIIGFAASRVRRGRPWPPPPC